MNSLGCHTLEWHHSRTTGIMMSVLLWPATLLHTLVTVLTRQPISDANESWPTTSHLSSQFFPITIDSVVISMEVYIVHWWRCIFLTFNTGQLIPPFLNRLHAVHHVVISPQLQPSNALWSGFELCMWGKFHKILLICCFLALWLSHMSVAALMFTVQLVKRKKSKWVLRACLEL